MSLSGCSLPDLAIFMGALSALILAVSTLCISVAHLAVFGPLLQSVMHQVAADRKLPSVEGAATEKQ